jgi:RNA polymerase sigma factor (sigma-70 family)
MKGKFLDPRNLLQGLKEGNKKAREHFFKKVQNIAFKYAEEYIKDRDKADIILAEAFQQVLVEIARFNRIEDATTFLLNIIEKACKQFVQERDGKTTGKAGCDNVTTNAAPSEGGDGEKTETDDRLMIQNIIESFPEKQHQKVGELFYLHGMRNKDVAEWVGITRYEASRYRMDCFKWLMEAFERQNSYRLYYWLLLRSKCFRKDAGFDTE